MRVVIVDDEPLVRERLRTLLAEAGNAEVVEECVDGNQAVSAILRHAPDLVLLDVQIPGPNGFDVIERVGASRVPAVVFVTAFDEYAVQAFEAYAVDYLLKPISERRFRTALERARARIASPAGTPAAASSPGMAYRERLSVRTGTGFQVIPARDLRWAEAADNYVKLHVGKESHLIRATMVELEGMLDPRRFARIHRSTLVNVDRVATIQPWGASEFLLTLDDGTKLSSSRQYRNTIRSVFGC